MQATSLSSARAFDDVEAASAEGELTRDSLAEIGTSVGSAVTAFETLQEAAPDDCDLD